MYCQIFRDSSYVALKVCVRTSPDQANLEETVNRHLSGLSTSHPGCFNIRQSLDDFYLHRANGFRHYCIVHEPLHTTMSQFQRLHGTARPLPEVLVKYFMQYLLQGLDFLHTEASVAHCGSLFRPISSGNLRSENGMTVAGRSLVDQHLRTLGRMFVPSPERRGINCLQHPALARMRIPVLS